MRTLRIDDELYFALREQARASEFSIRDLAEQAIVLWLAAGELDEDEFAEDIEAFESDLQETGLPDAVDFLNRIMVDWLEGSEEEDLEESEDIAEIAISHGYRRLFQMGEEAIPVILDELEIRPALCLMTLSEITGANPVPESDRGNLTKMIEAWFNWAEQNGYYD